MTAFRFLILVSSPLLALNFAAIADEAFRAPPSPALAGAPTFQAVGRITGGSVNNSVTLLAAEYLATRNALEKCTAAKHRRCTLRNILRENSSWSIEATAVVAAADALPLASKGRFSGQYHVYNSSVPLSLSDATGTLQGAIQSALGDCYAAGNDVCVELTARIESWTGNSSLRTSATVEGYRLR